MKPLVALLACLLVTISGFAATESPIDSLVGRGFSIEDDWAGQEVAFLRKEGGLVAAWRILGSGRPVVSEKEYPVEVKGPTLGAFSLDRAGKHYDVKIDLSQKEVRLYVDGFRIHLKEQLPATATKPQ